MIGKTLKKPLRLERSIRAGIKVGVFILTAACTVTVAKLGWETIQSRTGTVGGEVLILPMIILLVYIGWTARKEWTSLVGESEAKKSYNKIGRPIWRPNHTKIISPGYAICQSTKKSVKRG